MSKKNRSKPVASLDNKNILNEIKYFLTKLVGDRWVTFNQFTDILDKDNLLRIYNRKSLLSQRERFFKRKEAKRGRKNSREIQMPLDNFVNFLDSIAQKGAVDLVRFKKVIIYCLEFGIVVGK